MNSSQTEHPLVVRHVAQRSAVPRCATDAIRRGGLRFVADYERYAAFTAIRSILIALVMATIAAHLVTPPALAQDAAAFDVVVYGGTSAGVTAAVQAARMGKRVALVEPGRHLGGMSSSGLGMTDLGVVHTVGGLAIEFYQRVYRHYTDPKSWTHGIRAEFVAWMPKTWGVDGPRMEDLKAQFLFEPHAVKGKQCDGERVAELLVKMASAFKPVTSVSEAVTVLIEKRVFSSRDYWTERATAGRACSGDLVASVIAKFVATVNAK